MNFVFAEQPLSVVINEIAWMGTENNSSDEWIELFNNTEQAISLENWGLFEAGGETLIEPLTGIIKPKSYYLIERTDDTTISDILASQKPSGWGGYGLKNTGEHLRLLDQNSAIIDEIICSAGWFGGDNETKQTMERKNPLITGNNPENWQTSVEPGGTPKSQNSKITESKKMAENRSLPTEPDEPDTKDKSVEVKLQQTEIKAEAENYTSSSEALSKSQNQNQLAAISKNLPGSKIFLIAFALAIFSGISVFLLKRKSKMDLFKK